MNSWDEFVTLEIVGWDNVAEVRFNRPDHHNAVTGDMVEELHTALDTLSGHSEVDVVVLTGNGTMFCPGADLSRAAAETGPDATTLPPRHAYHSARLLHEMPQVTVAAVNGACAGAGMAWASACDLRVASDQARFATAFLQVGLASELGLVWHLQRLLGSAVARDLCFLPRKLTAGELQSLGYLSAVFPAATFQAEAHELISELAGRGAAALRTLKANFVDAGRLSLDDYLDIETQRHQAFFTGSDGLGV